MQRACPICGASPETAALFLAERIDRAKMSEFSFASRKLPEFMNHRLVRCTDCKAVFAPEPPTSNAIEHAYHQAAYDSSVEADDAADTYQRGAMTTIGRLARRESMLEIGAGNGAFLERMASAGFTQIVGVEPSSAAIAAAPGHRKPWLREGIFRGADFAPHSFDLITCFMTMEHVYQPTTIVADVFRLLRPGGAFITVTHDYEAPLNRTLGRRSPIIDIEHLQLFSKASIRRLLADAGFTDVTVVDFANRYRFRYWLRLTPLPIGFKNAILAAAGVVRLAEMPMRFNVGNIMAMAVKPTA